MLILCSWHTHTHTACFVLHTILSHRVFSWMLCKVFSYIYHFFFYCFHLPQNYLAQPLFNQFNGALKFLYLRLTKKCYFIVIPNIYFYWLIALFILQTLRKTYLNYGHHHFINQITFKMNMVCKITLYLLIMQYKLVMKHPITTSHAICA